MARRGNLRNSIQNTSLDRLLRNLGPRKDEEAIGLVQNIYPLLHLYHFRNIFYTFTQILEYFFMMCNLIYCGGTIVLSKIKLRREN